MSYNVFRIDSGLSLIDRLYLNGDKIQGHFSDSLRNLLGKKGGVSLCKNCNVVPFWNLDFYPPYAEWNEGTLIPSTGNGKFSLDQHLHHIPSDFATKAIDTVALIAVRGMKYHHVTVQSEYHGGRAHVPEVEIRRKAFEFFRETLLPEMQSQQYHIAGASIQFREKKEKNIPEYRLTVLDQALAGRTYIGRGDIPEGVEISCVPKRLELTKNGLTPWLLQMRRKKEELLVEK